MKYFRTALLFTAVFCIHLAWSVFAPPAAAFSRETVEGSDTGLFWPDMPVGFAINSKCSGGSSTGTDTNACIAAVTESYKTWAGPSCTYLRFKDPTITGSTETGNDDDTNLVVWRFDQWSYSPAALAMTTTTYYKPSGQIVDADIEVNGVTGYQWKVLDQKGGSAIDIQNTITHEVGHVIGLDHSTVKSAVMYYSAVPGEISKRVLAQDDIDGLCTIYPVGSQPDGGSSSDSGGGGGGGGCNTVELSL